MKSAVSADSGGNASALRDAEEDWPAFARGLDVGGLAKQLAQQSELVRFEQEEIELRVPPLAKHLAEKLYQDKLRAALEEQFGQPVRLVVKVGELRGDTAQDRAVSSIQRDEFVRGLVEGLDATIVTASIKPVH